MSRLAKILESKDIAVDEVMLDSGHGVLPSICPKCAGSLDFGRIGEDELVCRNKCGYRYITEFKL